MGAQRGLHLAFGDSCSLFGHCRRGVSAHVLSTRRLCGTHAQLMRVLRSCGWTPTEREGSAVASLPSARVSRSHALRAGVKLPTTLREREHGARLSMRVNTVFHEVRSSTSGPCPPLSAATIGRRVRKARRRRTYSSGAAGFVVARWPPRLAVRFLPSRRAVSRCLVAFAYRALRCPGFVSREAVPIGVPSAMPKQDCRGQRPALGSAECRGWTSASRTSRRNADRVSRETCRGWKRGTAE